MELATYQATFAERNFSWEREHSFTSAATCFDTFVWDHTGKASVLFWAPLEGPFRETPTLRPAIDLHAALRSFDFTLDPQRLGNLHTQLSLFTARQGLEQYFDPDDRVLPDYFLHFQNHRSEALSVRSCGLPSFLIPLLHAVRSAMPQSVDGILLAETSADMISKLQAGWNFDYFLPSTSDGKVIIPAAINSKREPIL